MLFRSRVQVSICPGIAQYATAKSLQSCPTLCNPIPTQGLLPRAAGARAHARRPDLRAVFPGVSWGLAANIHWIIEKAKEFQKNICFYKGFPCSSLRKESACNAGDLAPIPRLGRSPGEGHGNPLQYSCWENLMDRRTWWATLGAGGEGDDRG